MWFIKSMRSIEMGKKVVEFLFLFFYRGYTITNCLPNLKIPNSIILLYAIKNKLSDTARNYWCESPKSKLYQAFQE